MFLKSRLNPNNFFDFLNVKNVPLIFLIFSISIRYEYHLDLDFIYEMFVTKKYKKCVKRVKRVALLCVFKVKIKKKLLM